MKTNVTLKADYKIGEKIDMFDRIYTVVGYEYFPARAHRYILAHGDNGGTVKWEYLYKFEIEQFRNK